MLIIKLILSLAFCYNYQHSKEFPIEAKPTYFFKPSYNGRYFAYTTWGRGEGTASTNYIYDSWQQRLFEIPGPFDPIFLLNNTSLIIPKTHPPGYAFFNLNHLLQKELDTQPVYIDNEFKGVYQSVAILNQSDHLLTYRIMSENGAVRNFRDYQVHYDRKMNITNVRAISDIKPLCTNFKFSLPMISKQGDRFAGLDQEDGFSKIFHLNDDGTCSVLANLGFITGKIAFAYNPRYIAYHKFTAKVEENHILIPRNDISANLFLFDLKTLEEKQLTFYDNGNAMYPEFIENDDIVYIYHPNSGNKKVSFNRLQKN